MSSTVEGTAAANENGNQSSEEKCWEKTDRELLMIIATFVTAVAFQAGVPPGYEAGKSIMATKSPYEFCAFIAGVTVCLACSVLQLLSEFPLQKLSASTKFLQFMMDMAITSMASAYGSSIKASTPEPLMPRFFLVLVLDVVISVHFHVLTEESSTSTLWCSF